MDKGFDIPVVLLIFKRADLLERIIDRVRQVRPRKVYILGDGGRTAQEQKEVEECRGTAEKYIDWECEIIRNYAQTNRGVYENIGKGARWVFEREKTAIFLEDDNLPEVTFFRYCQEMLERFQDDDRVLWICGTNYLEKYDPEDGSSYVFTQHLLPCGWASWSDKFCKMYDGDMIHFEDKGMKKKLKYAYESRTLYRQQYYAMAGTLDKIINKKRVSWDHQMCFSLRSNSAFGIAPKVNQIQNIGVDERSTHGGVSMRNVMTRRFCGIKSYPLEFPLVHPKNIMKDSEFEKRTKNIILMPLPRRIIIQIVRIIKPIFGFSKYDSFSLGALKTKVRHGNEC